jgi:hypothetical protein
MQQKITMKKSLLCLVDETGTLDIASPEPFRVGFLLTAHPERLLADIRILKTELPPRSKSGEYHASEDHPLSNAMIRAILGINNEPQMIIVEWHKTDFSPNFVVKGKLRVTQDFDTSMASFALMASHIAALAFKNENPSINIVVEGSKNDIRSEHRSREQAFSRTIHIAIQKQLELKRPSKGTETIIQISTRRKHEYPLLSFVDYWLWAYQRHTDRKDTEVFPEQLKRRTTIQRMRESDISRTFETAKS